MIDEDDNVYMIHRGIETDERIAVTFLPAPNYSYRPKKTLILYNEALGYSEPIIDRTRWKQEKILSLLIQNNEQPNGDVSHHDSSSNVVLLDVVFEKPSEDEL